MFKFIKQFIKNIWASVPGEFRAAGFVIPASMVIVYFLSNRFFPEGVDRQFWVRLMTVVGGGLGGIVLTAISVMLYVCYFEDLILKTKHQLKELEEKNDIPPDMEKLLKEHDKFIGRKK